MAVNTARVADRRSVHYDCPEDILRDAERLAAGPVINLGNLTFPQIVVHLAQSELALTTRVRFAASAPGYVAQPFDQDAWIALDHADGPTAVDAYVALRRFNLAMFKNMSPKLRRQPFTHPEYGELTPDWVAAQLAGHELHHLRQLKQIK